MQSKEKLFHGRDDEVDDVSDLCVQQVDQGPDVGAATAGRANRVGDRHNQSSVELHLHVSARRIDGECYDRCLIYKVADVGAYSHALKSGGMVNVRFPFVRLSDGNIEEPVLVTVVEFTEDGEQGRKVEAWALLRLHTLNCCPNGKAKRFDVEMLFTPSLLVVRDNKHELLEDALGDRRTGLRFVYGDCVHEIVESGTEIVNEIAESQRPVFKRGAGVNVDHPTMPGEIIVHFVRDSVGFSISPCLEFTLNYVSMLLSAPQFGVNARQV